jgi:hypothetical protein
VARFRRLRSGEWGVSVSSPDNLTGQEVLVERRDGRTTHVRLTQLVAGFRDIRHPALYAIENTRSTAPRVAERIENGQNPNPDPSFTTRQELIGDDYHRSVMAQMAAMERQSDQNVAFPGDEADEEANQERQSLTALAAAFESPPVVEDEADRVQVEEREEDKKPLVTVAISASSALTAENRETVTETFRAVAEGFGYKFNTVVFR